MAHSTDEQTDRDLRLDAILGAYYDAVHAGEQPDRLAWVASHPEFAAELAAYFVEQDRLHHLAGPLRAAARPAPETRVLGDYELFEEIARGGMGVVYKARQVRLNRIVALKLILAGELAGPTDIQRFTIEAEAAAALDHPNIVPIYEVGRDQGRYFFSMKLFEGGSLASHLDRYFADPRAAASLVATVARAVHHAHQRGILHRDLKPSNILLDAEGRPHVVDFGLAKRIAAEGDLTESGALLGSPSYMAPEQTTGRRGVVTTASDIYGLGALLYTLLAKRTPFQADSAWETIAQARDRAPESLDALNPSVDRDLQTVCLKCLEKDPMRRYGSAEALADDLERWMRKEPIAARPVGRIERFQRLCRRNLVVTSLIGAVASLVMAGFIGLAVSNVLVSRQRNEALGQRARAAKRARQARDAADRMLAELANSALLGKHKLDPIRHDLLERAPSIYEEFDRDQAEDPSLDGEAAYIALRLGELHAALDQRPEAQRDFLRAIDRAGRRSPRLDDHRVLVKARLGLARQHFDLGRREEAIREYLDALPLAEALAQAEPTGPDARADVGHTHHVLGFLLYQLNRPAESEHQLRGAEPIFRKLATEHPETEAFHFHLAETLKFLGHIRRQRGDLPGARLLNEDAVTHLKFALAAKPYSPVYLSSLRDRLEELALLWGDAGQPSKAIDAHADALNRAQALAAEYPDVIGFRQTLARSHYNHAYLLAGVGRAAEAKEAIGRSLGIYRALVADFPEDTGYRKELAVAQDMLRTVSDPADPGPRETGAGRTPGRDAPLPSLGKETSTPKSRPD